MRGRRRNLYVGAFAAAAIAAATLIAVSQLTHRGSAKPTAAPRGHVAPAAHAALFAGIAQHGNVLGSPRAPVTMVEYADLQCPYCGEFARMTLPELVRDYVRTGKVRLVFRGMAFVGPDSQTALRAVVAAGEQNRLWDLTHLLYANQGQENTGWVTEDLLRSLAGQVPALDVGRLLDDARSGLVTGQLEEFAQLAGQDAVNGTPSFRIGRTGAALTPLEIRSLDAGAFRPALNELLRS